MKSIKNKDKLSLIIYGFLVSVSILSIHFCIEFPHPNIPNDIGSAAFPILYSVFLLLLSTTGLILSLLKQENNVRENVNYFRTLIAIILNIITISLINIIGFYISIFLFSFSIMLLLGIRSKFKIILLPFIITIIIFIIFNIILNVPLPTGYIFD
ncbi:tripartite tricarboxylate transporter TctB family protein [Gallibacterium anatis]|uniref:tripartite tricarboxylate transporter TctB family protein n=1 Tax=Gallibacterium anatis TaxID=750 RepID=UPI0005320EB3|nr:tripartite tricarboxylate transporter TctB family protein [Gallibacterium anatis]KGQ63734.1 hypothetical protein IO49_10315 [Gallibacterium anatis]